MTYYSDDEEKGWKKIAGGIKPLAPGLWMSWKITEKRDPLPDAEEWTTREKSEEDILTWDAAE